MLFFSLLLSLAMAGPRRISQSSVDLSETASIKMTHGLVTVIEFPKPIIEVRVGNAAILKAQISSVSPKELTLSLVSSELWPTNLVVRSDRRVYVFDVFPNLASHQDYIRVNGYGSPSLDPVKASIVERTELSLETKGRTQVGGKVLEKALLE